MIEWLHAFVDVPGPEVETAQRFWAAAAGASVTAPWPDHPEFVSLRPADGSPYLHVQRIDGPSRVHVDLAVGDVDAEGRRLASLGASFVQRFAWWQVMASPGGLPFCLVEDPDRVRPGPVTWPDGHRSRLTGVCLDIPETLHGTETSFWRAATGWTLETGRLPEFAFLRPPRTSALYLLLQRLGEDDPRDATSAHLDLGTDDIPAEVRRVVSLGATPLEPPVERGRWVVLSDPAGLPFCVTQQPPD